MTHSKSKIDKAGRVLSGETPADEIEYIELEEVFDDYRKAHLEPLTQVTLELQSWLKDCGTHYFIAQRLKRKPQILRKLKRLSVRLTQLQDIGGCRIVVSDNMAVDKIGEYIADKISSTDGIALKRRTDYRERGRDVTGYRALHLMLQHTGIVLELQIRSRVQHYWAESIERASVIYGYHLKEQEGDSAVLNFFRQISDMFYELESGREPTPLQKLDIDKSRADAEAVVRSCDRHQVYNSSVPEDIIKTLASIQLNRQQVFNNWILVFNWNVGSFVTWSVVGRSPDEAVASYVAHEHQFPASEGYEVVLIGSSDIATVRQTHSHYFGIDSYENVIANIDPQVAGYARRLDIDADARNVLLYLYRKHYWGKKGVSVSTLRNHYCRDVGDLDRALRVLADLQFIQVGDARGPVSLNMKQKNRIEQYI